MSESGEVDAFQVELVTDHLMPTDLAQLATGRNCFSKLPAPVFSVLVITAANPGP